MTAYLYSSQNEYTSVSSLIEDYTADKKDVNYWSWKNNDTYIAAAGVVSTITDMLKYGEMHLNDSPAYLALSHKTNRSFEKEGLSMGLGWIIDPETDYIWHNGGTSSYTSFTCI